MFGIKRRFQCSIFLFLFFLCLTLCIVTWSCSAFALIPRKSHRFDDDDDDDILYLFGSRDSVINSFPFGSVRYSSAVFQRCVEFFVS